MLLKIAENLSSILHIFGLENFAVYIVISSLRAVQVCLELKEGTTSPSSLGDWLTLIGRGEGAPNWARCQFSLF